MQTRKLLLGKWSIQKYVNKMQDLIRNEMPNFEFAENNNDCLPECYYFIAIFSVHYNRLCNALLNDIECYQSAADVAAFEKRVNKFFNDVNMLIRKFLIEMATIESLMELIKLLKINGISVIPYEFFAACSLLLEITDISVKNLYTNAENFLNKSDYGKALKHIITTTDNRIREYREYISSHIEMTEIDPSSNLEALSSRFFYRTIRKVAYHRHAAHRRERAPGFELNDMQSHAKLAFKG